MSDHHKTEGGVPTTGHVWDDDLADFTNQPPKWWMLGLTASAIWVVVYFTMYPAVPIAVAGMHFKGVGLPGTGQWTAINELSNDSKELDEVRGKYEQKLKGMTPAAILADKEMSEYSVRAGKVLFSDNCAACHGQNGVGTRQEGAKFAAYDRGLMAPVLNDDDWLYGGTIDKLYETISGGRQGMMVAHKDTLSAAEIDTLANAVAKGEPLSTPLFTEKGCVGCHGMDAKGQQAMGSANLTDKIWRFDGSVEGIKQTITYGVNSGDPQARVAVMPTWLKKDEHGLVVSKLDETAIKKLAVYVYKFGGGQADAPVAPTADAAPSVATTAPLTQVAH